MKIDVMPGTYVVAVSGGVDSVVLLDLLTSLPETRVIVAHFDHGIRYDSALDRKFVQELAEHYHVNFVYDIGSLGQHASEDDARKARYNFLHKVRESSGAKAVITAHHKDDAIETAVLQIIRGTGRKGLGSLRNTDVVLRPLLSTHKRDLLEYAKKHNLSWREDSTNIDRRYLRNHIRHDFIPKLSEVQERSFHTLIERSREINDEVDNTLDLILHLQPSISIISRYSFIHLPHIVSMEVMAHFLRRHGVREFDSKLLERLVVFAKTARSGQQIDVNKQYVLSVKGKNLALLEQER